MIKLDLEKCNSNQNLGSSSFDNSSMLGNKRAQYRNSIRSSQLENIRKAKRVEFYTCQMIENILSQNFPHQGPEARCWAEKLLGWFQNNRNYQLQSYHLRQIFQLTQKFPSVNTLQLFWVALKHSESKNVQELFTLDVLGLLHRVLQFPEVQKSQGKNTVEKDGKMSETEAFSPPSGKKQLNLKFVAVEMVKVTINILRDLYQKGMCFRNFSIATHKTFTHYVYPTYKKYHLSIKTELLHLCEKIFLHTIIQFQNEYIKVINFVVDNVFFYFELYQFILKNDGWSKKLAEESLLEMLIRGNTALNTLILALTQRQKWLIDYIQGRFLSSYKSEPSLVLTFIKFNYFSILDTFRKKQNLPSNELQTIVSLSLQYLENVLRFHGLYIQIFQVNTKEQASVLTQINKFVLQILFYVTIEAKDYLNYYLGCSVYSHLETLSQTCFFSLSSFLDDCVHSQKNKIIQLMAYQQSYSDTKQQFRLLQLFLLTLEQYSQTNSQPDMLQMFSVFCRLPFESLRCDETQGNFNSRKTNLQLLVEVFDLLTDKLTEKFASLDYKNHIVITLIELFLGQDIIVDEKNSQAGSIEKSRTYDPQTIQLLAQHFLARHYQKIVKYIQNEPSFLKHFFSRLEQLLSLFRKNLQIQNTL